MKVPCAYAWPEHVFRSNSYISYILPNLLYVVSFNYSDLVWLPSCPVSYLDKIDKLKVITRTDFAVCVESEVRSGSARLITTTMYSSHLFTLTTFVSHIPPLFDSDVRKITFWVMIVNHKISLELDCCAKAKNQAWSKTMAGVHGDCKCCCFTLSSFYSSWHKKSRRGSNKIEVFEVGPSNYINVTCKQWNKEQINILSIGASVRLWWRTVKVGDSNINRVIVNQRVLRVFWRTEQVYR